MTLEETIKLAREQGNIIEFVRRKDGGIRVTKVNGKKYQSNKSAGNAAVRNMVGSSAKLTAKQTIALKKNRSQTKAKVLGKKLNKEFNKANKRYKKYTGKAVKSKDVKRTKKKKGKQAVKDLMKRMDNAVRHKLDFTYSGEVASFVSTLEDASNIPNKQGETYDFSHLIDYIEDNSNYISESALQECIKIFYDWQNALIDGDMAEIEMVNEITQGIYKLKSIEQDLE